MNSEEDSNVEDSNVQLAREYLWSNQEQNGSRMKNAHHQGKLDVVAKNLILANRIAARKIILKNNKM